MGRDDPKAAPGDYAYLEGRVLRLEGENARLDREQKAIRRIHDLLGEQVEGLTLELRRFREDRDPWRETTDVRNQRRAEIESLRSRARDAEDAELELHRVKTRFWQKLGLLAPAGAALLYALAEVVKAMVQHH